MKVFIKKMHENARLPDYAHDDDAGIDVSAAWMKDEGRYIEYGCGWAMQIDRDESKDWYIKCRPRSSISKYDLTLSNSVSTIDNGYTGEIIFRFKKAPNIFNLIDGLKEEIVDIFAKEGPFSNFIKFFINFDFEEFEKKYCKYYKVNDKIGQMILEKRPKIEIIETNFISETKRGDGGFGSTGR